MTDFTLKIWDKTKEQFVEFIDFPDGESLSLAVTPNGKVIQYGEFTDHINGEVANPENYKIIIE